MLEVVGGSVVEIVASCRYQYFNIMTNTQSMKYYYYYYYKYILCHDHGIINVPRRPLRKYLFQLTRPTVELKHPIAEFTTGMQLRLLIGLS